MPPYNLQWNTAKGHFQKPLSDSIILFLLIFVIIYVLNFMVRFNRIIFYSDMRLLTICLFVLLKEQATVTKKVIFQLEVYFCSLTGSLVFCFFSYKHIQNCFLGQSCVSNYKAIRDWKQFHAFYIVPLMANKTFRQMVTVCLVWEISVTVHQWCTNGIK